ncbi:CLUMA_CG005392, isoform A [Clunio marinus]|uniref:CLUMA_CG005392, isoform A n=1 Tax=Clunio marinus TaxID=568069 RepID=A0A1J1HYZ2_9DIPT|nr:CLUMA_CG005392, isoform A [Clunio marinus]
MGIHGNFHEKHNAIKQKDFPEAKIIRFITLKKANSKVALVVYLFVSSLLRHRKTKTSRYEVLLSFPFRI